VRKFKVCVITSVKRYPGGSVMPTFKYSVAMLYDKIQNTN